MGFPHRCQGPKYFRCHLLTVGVCTNRELEQESELGLELVGIPWNSFVLVLSLDFAFFSRIISVQKHFNVSFNVCSNLLAFSPASIHSTPVHLAYMCISVSLRNPGSIIPQLKTSRTPRFLISTDLIRKALLSLQDVIVYLVSSHIPVTLQCEFFARFGVTVPYCYD